MEANNMKAMREALMATNSISTGCLKHLLAELVESDIPDGGQINRTIAAVDRAKAALAKPPRNCDVGTAEEQFERWHAFCDSYDKYCTDCPCDGPVLSMAYCFSNWAQMPYREGEPGGSEQH